MPHVVRVTAKALEIAHRLNLPEDQIQFIEEACMLHDIGIVKVNSVKIGCHGELPYVQHIIEGKRILIEEGYPEHARVAENHLGVGGLTALEIIEGKMPLPHKDILCDALPDKIISYADLWFSKNPTKVFVEKDLKQVRDKVKNYGRRQERVFKEMYQQFEGKSFKD